MTTGDQGTGSGSAPGLRSGLRERAPAALVALAFVAIAIVAVGHLTSASNGGTAKSRLNGTGKGERIYGTQGDDLIRGNGGSDKLIARNGADRVYGGGGHDKIRGGKGDDQLIAGKGGAVMYGGLGRDEFNMSSGTQVAGQGRDVIHARDGTADEINCGPGGNDVAYVDGSEDGIYDCELIITPSGSAP